MGGMIRHAHPVTPAAAGATARAALTGALPAPLTALTALTLDGAER